MESLQQLFKLLDLTGFDAKVYVTLLSTGPASPSRLVEELSTHRPQVHGSLKRLAARGLVEVYSGRPAMYRAVPPDVALDVVEEEYGELVEEARKYLDSLGGGGGDERHGVWMYKSSKGLLSRFAKTIEGAGVDLVACGDAMFLAKLMPLLREAQERGVVVYTLVYEIPGVEFREEVFRGLRKVKKAVSGDLMVIADSKIGVLAQRRLGAEGFPGYGVVVEEPVLIDYLLQDFLYRWRRSAAVRDEALSLPVRLTMFKLATLEAARLLEGEKPLFAEARGRWVRDGEGSVEGRVVEARIDDTTGIAQIVLDTGGRTVSVGGPDAIIEDFAASEVTLRGAE